MITITKELIKAHDYESAINLIFNLNKIYEYSRLQYNWNGNGAEPYTPEVIDLAWSHLMKIEKQPEVFPPAIGAIQFEWEKENGDYLDFEIYADRIELFMIVGGAELEQNLSTDADLNWIVNEFWEES